MALFVTFIIYLYYTIYSLVSNNDIDV